MNILFLNSLGKSKWGGGEKWMISAGSGLSDRGHQVIIACLPGSVIEQKARDAELGIFHFGISADIAFWHMYPLKAFLKKHTIDVLICCQNKDVKIGAKAARKENIPAIFSRQGIQNLSNKKKYIIPFTKYIDGIITNTSSIKKTYEAFGWFPENFIHVIYNGVQVPENAQKIDLHERYDIHKNAKIIFSSGRLDHQKGFDLLIDVASKAKEAADAWHIIVAGRGKLKNELQTMASKKGVSDVIHFIGFTTEIHAHLEGSTAFVLPSRYEGMPNALLEAMAAGKACVATNVNGAPELIENGISGFLVEPENTDQMYRKLKLLLEDPEMNRSMGEQAKIQVEQNFTLLKMTDNLESLFFKTIKANNLS